MEDRIVRAISGDGMVQAAAIYSRNLTERARQIHKTLPVATAALGRTLAGASMMGNALKGQGASLTLQIKGGGPLGTVLAVSDHEGNDDELATSQTQEVANGIYNLSTFFPAIIYALCGLALLLIYPLSKAKVEANVKELESRRK